MSQEDQVLSVRLRRKNTGTPWGFRMHGGAEYGTPIHIQHVNPKSLAYRQGLRVQDRLLAVGNAPTHSLSHEQVKMEIIRAGNELDFVVQRNPSAAGVDQQDSRPARKVQQTQQYNDPDEEPSEYRGYTNPKVQSRSFKILQESLSYTEADEEGTILPSGHIPGEGIVLRAYNEGKRRMQELAEINPRNFIAESPIYERGQNLLKCSEEDEEIIAKLKCSWKSNEPQVASSKSYTPGSSGKTTEQTQSVNGIDLSGSSVLAPAAAQQKYLQQAHAYYGDTNAPIIQTTSQPGIVYKTVQQSPQQAVQQPVQQTVQSTVHIPVQATQKAPRRRERKRQPKDQQTVTSPVAVTQASGFIPTTDTVSSVAEELNLKHESTTERSEIQTSAPPKPVALSEQANVQSVKTEVKKVQPQSKPKETVQTVQSVKSEVKEVQLQSKPEETVTTVQSVKTEVKKVQPQSKPEETVTTVQSVKTEGKEVQSQSKPEETVTTVQSVKTEVKEVQSQSKPEETVTTVQSVKTEVKEVQPQSKPVETVQTVIVQQETESVVIPKPKPDQDGKVEVVQQKVKPEKSSAPNVEQDKPDVDSVDATIEITGDVIQEYGEKMAETVILESLQDANQNIKDSTDGTLESKPESTEDTVSSKGVKPPANEVTEKSIDNKQQKPKPEIQVVKEEQVPDTGKLELKPLEENLDVKSQSEVEPVDKPVDQVVPVDNRKSEVVIEKAPAKEDSKVTELSAEIGKEEISKNEVKVETSATETETSSTEKVEVAQENTQASEIVENTEVSVQSRIENEMKEENSVASFDISGDNQSENVEITIAQTEGSFVAAEAEESSFVFQVQESSEDVASEVQSESFEISISEGTEESANITLDLSADVTIDSSKPEEASESAEVSISLDTNERAEAVIVQESEKPEKEQEPKVEKSSTDDKKTKQPMENKSSSSKSDNKKDNGPPKKAKFVDSQGGVSARLARFNLKKK